MNPKCVDTYLDKIEAAQRGFEHSNNTYYGYEYKTPIKPEPWSDHTVKRTISVDQLLEGLEKLEQMHKNNE